MMIGSLRKEQVRILRNDGEQTTIDEPRDHPQGMGVAGLLKSDMFGLPSTLDSQTLALLYERDSLVAMQSKPSFTPENRARLEYLRKHLDDLGFTREYRDPMYQLFIEQMYEARGLPLDKLFDAKELREREELAKKIVQDLVKREKTDELSALAQELSIEVKK